MCPKGIYLASGDEEGVVIIWHVNTSKMVKKYAFNNPITDIEWNPLKNLCLLTISSTIFIYFVNPKLNSPGVNESTTSSLKEVNLIRIFLTQLMKKECPNGYLLEVKKKRKALI